MKIPQNNWVELDAFLISLPTLLAGIGAADGLASAARGLSKSIYGKTQWSNRVWNNKI